MSSGWIRKPGPKHVCERPAEAAEGDRKYIGSVWRCRCSKLWIFREGWYFGEFPPWFYATVPKWHKARWWERLYWWCRLDEDDI